MSSKRKNTPTKLTKDELVVERSSLHNKTDAENSNSESEVDSDSQIPLHIVTKTDQSDADLSDSATYSPGSDRPRSKKQRILQSVQQDSGSESENSNNNNNNNISSHFTHDSNNIINNNNNNHIITTTKPSFGLQRKSMESVLKKLGAKPSDMQETGSLSHIGAGNHMAGTSAPNTDMLEGVQAVLNADELSVNDKDKRLSDLIAHLQILKESLHKQKVRQNFLFLCVLNFFFIFQI